MNGLIQVITLSALVGFGWLAGSFLAFHMLVIISCVCIVIFVVMSLTLQEMASLLTLLFSVCAVIVNVAMWLAYYVATNQTWFGEFILRNVLR